MGEAISLNHFRISRFDQPQRRFSPSGVFPVRSQSLPQELLVEDVVLGADRVDDEKMMTAFFPLLRGFEMLHPLLVFFPEGGREASSRPRICCASLSSEDSSMMFNPCLHFQSHPNFSHAESQTKREPRRNNPCLLIHLVIISRLVRGGLGRVMIGSDLRCSGMTVEAVFRLAEGY